MVTSQWRLSMNVCDWKLFQMLDDISPNIRKAYRLLKIIRNEVFPREFKSRKLRSSFYFLMEQKYFLKESQVVSSHVLENIVLGEVERHPAHIYWAGSLLIERIVSCLSSIQKNRYKSILTGKYQEILLTDISDNLVNQKLCGYIQQAIDDVKEYFLSPNEFFLDSTVPHDSIYILSMRNGHHTSDLPVYIRKVYRRNNILANIAEIRKELEIGEADSVYFYQASKVDISHEPAFLNFVRSYGWQSNRNYFSNDE